MTPGEVRAMARANLIRTYTDLGATTPGAHLEFTGAYTLCTSPIELVMGNFAMDFDPTLDRRQLDDALGTLAVIASQRPALRVFDLPGPKPAGLAHAMRRVGLVLRQELVQLARFGGLPGPVAELTWCEDPPSRRLVAAFMVDQFFAGLDSCRRAIVIDATASLGEISVVGPLEAPHAACTIVRTHGVLGVYNLCVAHWARRRGIGSAVVRRACEEAASNRLGVVLQCDPTLTNFYRRLGFEGLGCVGTYGFGRIK